MKILCAFILAMAVVLSADCKASEPSNVQPSKGEDVVLKVYHDYAWQAVMPMYFQNDVLTKQNEKVLSKYFVPALSALIKKDADCVDRTQDECNLGFDPIFASQDPEAADFEISDANAGIVIVKFVYPGDKSTISMEYHVQQTKDGWRISDIVYKGKISGSLREILSKDRKN
jgi:hypothetical protein